MRAVNLIPAEERRGAGGAAGRAGGMAYAVLGVLAAALVMVLAYTLVARSITHRKSELASVTAQADAAQAQADKLAPYVKFADLRAKRVETVSGLAGSRFDWAHAMHEVARTVPDNVWLSALTGSVDGSGTGAVTSVGRPSIAITGCTTDQKSVARMIARMRLVDGVQHVTLASSEKSGGTGSSGGSTGGCGAGDFPAFSMTIFFSAPPAAAAPATAPTATGGTP
jgi:Tfp pilus assembly protein PilN